MASKRQQIVNAIVNNLKAVDGTSPYNSNLYENVKGKLFFWDEVNDFPSISVVSGNETREYLPGGFKWGFLEVTIRIYVEDEDPKSRLEELFQDVEYVLDNNSTLTVSGNDLCTDMRIISISDDEGLLDPLGMGEIILQIQYQVD